jgi:DNA-binding CsgD family transcriptional regulator
LFITAVLTRRTGNLADSGSHLWSSARIALSIGYPMRLIDVLDEAGMQCVAAKRYAEAITLWAAMAVHNAATGLADTAEGERYRAEPVMEARSVLGPERFEAAEKRGAGMTLVAAVEYALMNVNAEAAASSQAPPRTTAAEEHLSVRERELVTLVAQGQTDAQIAEKLFISISTVRTHLDRIRDKTGCRRRADLTRYALSEGII